MNPVRVSELKRLVDEFIANPSADHAELMAALTSGVTDATERAEKAERSLSGIMDIIGMWKAAASIADIVPSTIPDLNLLAKLASGEGGRRTGLLKRMGYLEWTVTPLGLEVLAERERYRLAAERVSKEPT